MSDPRKRIVIIYQAREIWVVMCPSLPIQSEFGNTRDEALGKMTVRVQSYMREVSAAPPDLVNLQIVSIDAP